MHCHHQCHDCCCFKQEAVLRFQMMKGKRDEEEYENLGQHFIIVNS